MQTVAIFQDYANLDSASSSNGCRINQAELLRYLADDAEGRYLKVANAYVPIDPRQEHARDGRIADLWTSGYIVHTKVGTVAGQSYKCDFDVEMTMDMMKTAYELKPDIIVLVCGDSDFVPVVLELRKLGIRVEVASFDSSLSQLLANRCSGVISLEALVGQEATSV
ncbi:MAG: NYN domain-containing protein [Synergistaceae bacterium]|nr:NYN domain-containing protein [Synergistaceae bacterium]